MSDLDTAAPSGAGEAATDAAGVPDASAARTDPPVAAAPPERSHLVLTRSLRFGQHDLIRGQVVSATADQAARLPADAHRPATQAQVSIAEPGVITLED